MPSSGRLAWRAELVVRHKNGGSLMASLASETEVLSNSDGTYSIVLDEENARNLRAFWNTRMRSLEAASSVLSIIGNTPKMNNTKGV